MSTTQLKGSQIQDGTIDSADIDDSLEKEFTKLRVTTDDLTPDFLARKLISGNGIDISVTGPSGSNQALQISATGGGGGGGSPGGSSSQVQFNLSGSFQGNNGFVFEDSTSTLSLTNLAVTGSSTTIYGDSFEVTGSLSVTGGITGSITQLPNGSPYIVAGNNVTLTTSSSGQITISSTGGGGISSPGGSNTNVQFNLSGSLSGSSSFTFEPTSGILTVPGFSGDSFEITGSLSITNTGSGPSFVVDGNFLEITGSMSVCGGITGSITSLTDGSPYLVAGDNITLTTGSNGSVEIGLFSSLCHKVITLTSNHTLNGTEDVVALDSSNGRFSVNLPSIPQTGKSFIVKDVGGASSTNNVAVYGNGKMIDNFSSYVFTNDYSSVTLVYTGNAWSVTCAYNPISGTL